MELFSLLIAFYGYQFFYAIGTGIETTGYIIGIAGIALDYYNWLKITSGNFK